MNRLHFFHIVSFLCGLMTKEALAFLVPTFSRSNLQTMKTRHPIFHRGLQFDSLQTRDVLNTKLYAKTEKVQELESTNSESDWETVLKRDGVVKIESAISLDMVDPMRDYINDQKIMAWFAGQTFQGAGGEDEEWEAIERAFYGEKQSENVCDLQLSMQRGGYISDFGKNVSDAERHILADVLQDLFGPSGNLTSLYENLVSTKGELVEMAALVTEPGAEVDEDKVQSIVSIQNETNATSTAPLYSMMLALQDTTEHMAPMKFFKNTHKISESSDSEEGVNGDALSSPFLSTMKKGDVIIFDGRLLFSYNCNDAKKGSTCNTLHVSFKNPNITGDLGFMGSLRPGYAHAMDLGDLTKALELYGKGGGDAFMKYGDGISKEFVNTEAVEADEILLLAQDLKNETDPDDE